MFDTLTLCELYDLHTKLGAECRATHARMMDGTRPLIPVFSDQWQVLSAKCGELNETCDALYAEITRREQETVQCDCRTVADQGGEPRFWDCPVHHA
jgi:hypothetical protein